MESNQSAQSVSSNPAPVSTTPPINPLPKNGLSGIFTKIKSFIIEDKFIAAVIILASLLLIGGLVVALLLGKSSTPAPLPIPVNTNPPNSTQVNFSNPPLSSPSVTPQASSSATSASVSPSPSASSSASPTP